jgi:hypothetical protein
MKKGIAALAGLLVFGALTGSAFAFSDVSGEQAAPIAALKEKGIVSGITDDLFHPKAAVNEAQAVVMLAKAFDWKLPVFVKAPLASEYFTKIANDAWYAQAFIAAKHNGLELSADVDPNAQLTREQYAGLLAQAIDTTGEYPVTKMYIILKDEADVGKDYMQDIQRLVAWGIVRLEDGAFFPKQPMTRGEAAVWLHRALSFVKEQTKHPIPQEVIAVKVEAVTPEVNKVTLTRPEKPTAGYGIAIRSIAFKEDGTAEIAYALTNPKPGDMNAQVITTPSVSTYVASSFKPVAVPVLP